MTVYTAYFSFIIFVILLLLINSYFLISLNAEKIKDRKIEKRKEKIKVLLTNVFENENENENINKDLEIRKLKEHLKNKEGIEAFHYAVIEYYSQSEHKEVITQLLEEIVDIKKILKSNIVRKEYKEGYAL